MALGDPAKIRNVAVVGHRGAGKTSLVEALLYTSGAKNRLGNVSRRHDHHGPRRGRDQAADDHLGVTSAHVDWDRHRINLLDTPGEASFINEAMGSLPVVEGVLMVVNAVTKVEVQTERIWKRAAETGRVPRGRRQHDGPRARRLRRRAWLPSRAASATSGRAAAAAHRHRSRLQGRHRPAAHEGLRLRRQLGQGARRPTSRPTWPTRPKRRARTLVDRVAEADDALLEKYLEGGEISTAGSSFARPEDGRGRRVVSPILATSATKNIGIDRVLDVIEFALPSPAQGRGPLGARGRRRG